MPAAHHGEAVGAGEIAGGRQLRYRLLAGVDEVGILLALIGERTHAEHAVLALQLHRHAGRDVVGDQRRNADAEIDVEAVAQLLCRARRHFLASPRHAAPPYDPRLRNLLTALAHGALLDALHRILHMHDAL